MLRALLIDDETTARADLRAKLAAHPEVRIVGEAATLRTARERMGQGDYDLVFLDVQLIGGTAFELVDAVDAAARIIFVTAFDAFAVRAFEVNALDYLLKPVTVERLAQAVARVERARGTEPREPAGGAGAETAAPIGPLRLDDTVFLRAGTTARFVPVGTISAICAQDNYSEVRLVDGGKVFLRKSLKAWEACLPETHFMRVHRTQIVNLARVVGYTRDQDEHTRLAVEGLTEEVAASRERWGELRLRLQGLRRGP